MRGLTQEVLGLESGYHPKYVGLLERRRAYSNTNCGDRNLARVGCFAFLASRSSSKTASTVQTNRINKPHLSFTVLSYGFYLPEDLFYLTSNAIRV